ncbi:MAG: DUF934 domain-containing protein [Hyphomicrobiales bacterium]
MPVIRNGEIVADDWVRLEDEAPLPDAGDVILPLARLEPEADSIARRSGRTGVALPNSADPEDIAALLPLLDLVAVQFPVFTDGRAYSQARVLRRRFGYEGEIRATGNVLADQAAFMLRVGIDSFETDGRQPLETWRQALHAVTLAYQRGYRDRPDLAIRGTP